MGLGIKDIGTQNICLLLKLVHKLHFATSSAWAQWVRSRACITSLKGDLHGEHLDVLRSILPLYQAITTVIIGNGQQTSFWMDVWLGDDALADRFPALFSHCTKKEASVQERNFSLYRSCYPMPPSLISLIARSHTSLTHMGNYTTASFIGCLKLVGRQMMTKRPSSGTAKSLQECNSLCGFYVTNGSNATPTYWRKELSAMQYVKSAVWG
jgi:hypothetical protein